MPSLLPSCRMSHTYVLLGRWRDNIDSTPPRAGDAHESIGRGQRRASEAGGEAWTKRDPMNGADRRGRPGAAQRDGGVAGRRTARRASARICAGRLRPLTGVAQSLNRINAFSTKLWWLRSPCLAISTMCSRGPCECRPTRPDGGGGVSPAASVQAATWEAPVRPTACLGISDSNRHPGADHLIGFA